ncbi:MAG: hypothetical protein NT128_03935, partial [Proteobacteria bacterium]|nr:hypothetical protein [Pseudomonadota bacterium]
MKIAVFLIFTYLCGFVYGSTEASPAPVDDYLDKLKAAIGPKDPGELAYLDLRKIPGDNAQLLPFKERYIFLNGTSVVECTSEALLKEYILGHMGLAERSSYKVTDVAKAIAQQRISVRRIKLLMAHWLENEKHRFVKGVGCSHSIAEHRDRVKTSSVFGLYEREIFLQSCRPRGLVDDLLTLLLAESLVDVLLRTAPAPSAAAAAASVPEVSPAVSKDGEKKARARAKRAEERKKYRKRRSKRLADAKVAKAASGSGDGVDEVCAAKMVAATLAAVATTEDDQASESDDGETVPAAAASDGEDNVPVVVSSSQ